MFGQIESILNLLEKASEKKEEHEEDNNLKKVLIAIYKITESGSLGKRKLTKATKLSKLELFESIKKGKEENYLIEVSTDWGFDINEEKKRWKLSNEGRFYAEGLIEDLEENP